MRHFRSLAALALAVLLVAGPVTVAGAAPEPAPASTSGPEPVAAVLSSAPADTLEARVDSLMAEYDSQDSPGAVVGVVRGGEVAFVKGYGMADLAHGIPVTPETKFNVGSVAKQFLAFAVALLDSRGELSLDDPVAEHLTDWPTFEQTVTLRHLLTHTSGYREAYGTLSLAGRIPGRDYLSREEALEVVRRQPALEFPAGSDWKYNSTAWVILAEAAERVTGQPMSLWVTENVLRPLGMDQTVIERQVGQVIPDAAVSYTDAGEEDGGQEGGYLAEWSNRAIFGAAEVFTTVGDVAKWFRNFHTAELGGEAVQQQMRQPFVLTTGDTTDYALGLRIDEHRGLRRIGHGGSHAGYRAQFSYYPGLDAGVVVMSNYDGVSAGSVANRVAEMAFGDHMEPAEEPEPAPEPGAGEAALVDSALLARYSGRYEAESGAIVTFALEDGTLETAEIGSVVALSDSVFRAEGLPVTIHFHRTADGSVTGATVETPDGPRSLDRIEPWEPTAADLEAYAGRYYSSELETFYTLRVDGGALVAEHRWRGRAELAPLMEGRFRMDGGIRLRFERNEVGVVTGFYATIGRTADVWFGKER